MYATLFITETEDFLTELSQSKSEEGNIDELTEDNAEDPEDGRSRSLVKNEFFIPWCVGLYHSCIVRSKRNIKASSIYSCCI